PLRPEVAITLVEECAAGVRLRLTRRLFAFTRDLVTELLAPLHGEGSGDLSAAARGLVYQLEQGLGTAHAALALSQVAGLDSQDRRLLQRLGVHLGEHIVYLPALLKAGAMIKRAALSSAYW